MITRFIARHWPLLACGAALVGLLIFSAVLRTQLDKAIAEKNAAVAEKNLRDELLRQQNEAVDELFRQRREDREAYLSGIRAANKQAIQLEVDAGQLLRLPSPPTRDAQCAAAEHLLRKELQ